MKPPAGLVDCCVAKFYCLELKFLDNESNKQPLCQQDTTHQEFLCGMAKTYCNLTSSIELDILIPTEIKSTSSINSSTLPPSIGWKQKLVQQTLLFHSEQALVHLLCQPIVEKNYNPPNSTDYV